MNLLIKFGTNPSTIFLVIVVTDRHTDRQTHKPTPIKTYSLAFAGRINAFPAFIVEHFVCQVWRSQLQRFLRYREVKQTDKLEIVKTRHSLGGPKLIYSFQFSRPELETVKSNSQKLTSRPANILIGATSNNGFLASWQIYLRYKLESYSGE